MAQLTLRQFGQTVKDKYPEYKDVDNIRLARKMLEKYPQYSDRVKGQQGRFRETIQDIKETGQELGQTFTETRQAASQQFQRGATGEVAAPRAGLRMVGEIFGGLGRAAGSIFTGAGKALLGQRAEERVGQGAEFLARKAIESRPGQFIAREAEQLKETAPGLYEDIRAGGQIAGGLAEVVGAGQIPGAVRRGARVAQRLAQTTPARRTVGALESGISGAREFVGDIGESVFKRQQLSQERNARVIAGVKKDYTDNIFTTTSNRRRIQQANQNLSRYETDVLEEMAKRGITPDIEDGKAVFNNQIERLDTEIGTVADELDFELQRYSRVRQEIDELKTRVEQQIRNNPLLADTGRVNKVIKQAKARLDDIAADKGRDYLTVPELNNFKRALYKESSVYKKVNPDFNKADGAYELAQVAREAIHGKVGDVDVRALNQEMAKAIEVRHFLDRAGSPAVRGGRLGTMAGQATGAVIGTASNLPVLGPIIGATAGRVVARLFQKASVSPLRRFYLKKIAKGYDDALNQRLVRTLERIENGEVFDIPKAELMQIQDDLRKQPYLLGPARPGQPRQQTIGQGVTELGERGATPRGLGDEPQPQNILQKMQGRFNRFLDENDINPQGGYIRPDLGTTGRQQGVRNVSALPNNITDDLLAEARKYNNVDEFVEKNIDNFVSQTPEFKEWSSNAKEIIEAYHGSPYEFDKFEIGKKQSGAYDTGAISFARTAEEAEPFSRQYPDWYVGERQKIKNKFPKIDELLEREKEISSLSNTRSATNLQKEVDELSSYLKRDWEKNKDWLYPDRSSFERRRADDFDQLRTLKNRLSYRQKQEQSVKPLSKTEEKSLASYKKELSKLENSIQGNVYKVFIKGDKIIEESGEEIGFGAVRDGMASNLDNEILFIKDADTGQYIGDEIMVNDPSQVFIVNSQKTRSQLEDIWKKANAKN